MPERRYCMFKTIALIIMALGIVANMRKATKLYRRGKTDQAIYHLLHALLFITMAGFSK